MIMKKFMRLLAAFVAIGSLVSCEPEVDDEGLPAKSISTEDIDISVTQNVAGGNIITMKNNTPNINPYWQYETAKGDLLGYANTDLNTVTFPFAGAYNVYFTALTRGGGVEATPIVVNVAQNDENFFSDPRWALLTNGIAGKTWVLDMESPIGWAGFDYPYNPTGGDAWSWLPTYAEANWAMADKNWGEMTFALNGGYNVSVTQTALNTNDQTTKTGTFEYKIEEHTITLNGGVEMLFGGDYHPDVSNWKTLNLVELTENSMRLSVVRDQARNPNDGPCQIVFHFKPKE